MDWCLGALACAIALYGAVRLVSAVWVELLIGILVIVIAATATWLLRRRHQRW